MLIEQQPNTHYHSHTSPSSSGATGRLTTLPPIVGELDVDATPLVTFLANLDHV
jgi:hypothetical protein